MAWGLHDSIEIEKYGRPAVTIVTTAFTGAAEARAAALGMPRHPRVTTEHPLGSRTKPEVEAMVERAVDRVIAALVRP